MRIQRYCEGQPITLRSIDEVNEFCLEYARHLPIPMNKESDDQKAARQQQADFNKQLLDIYKTQFSESQDILKVLTPQLEGMAANPEGFGATEYAALQAKIINDVGAQYSDVAKTASREFATTNEAGLPSGVEAQVQGEIAAGAAGAEAGNLTNLAVANEQEKERQREFATSSLAGISGGLAANAGTTAGQEIGGTGQQFQEATTVYNQGGLWKNILSGVVGAGLDIATGGISGGLNSVLNQGQSFGSGFAAGAFG